MSKQRNRHRRNGKPKSDNPEQNGVSTGNRETGNSSYRAKSVVSTNVTKKTQNNEKPKSTDNDQNRRTGNNRQQPENGRRSKRHRSRRKKNKNSKLRNVRQEDLFQLKDPKRARRLQNRKRRPRNFTPYTLVKADSTVCPICQKKIDNMADTITDRRSGQPAHFECVHEELLKTLKLQDSQRLSYIGSGTFAVLEDVAEDGRTKFRIKEKFEYVK